MAFKVSAAGSTAKQTITVKNRPISQSQTNVAITLLQAASQANAPENAVVALIISGICESSLALGTYSYNPTRQGPLSPPVGSFTGTGLTQATQQAEEWLTGGPHFGNGIQLAAQYPNTVDGLIQLAQKVEGCGQQYYNEFSSSWTAAMCVAEARGIVSVYTGLTVTAGGVSGDGTSTGTSINDSLPSGFQMGTTDSPDQDMWTTINQLAQERQWYLFSDGETVYLADGPDLLQQDPVMTLDRLKDTDKILDLSFTWDNGLALDTLLPTPSGWTTMGAIREGDLLIGSDGASVRVIGKSPVKHQPCYEVRFDDGSAIVADDTHNWSIDRYKWHKQGPRVQRQVQTRDLASGDRVALISPLSGPSWKGTDPYLLGYWLGDGTTGSGIIGASNEDAFSLISEIQRAGLQFNARAKRATSSWSRADTYILITAYGLAAQLRGDGILHKKRIPDALLRSSVIDRVALLQGLMDSDGSVSGSRSVCTIAQVDKLLSDQILELLRGLGIKARQRVVRARGNNIHDLHTIEFRPTEIPVFRLSRKRSVYSNATSTLKRWKKITSILEIPSVPTQCVAVASADHLYAAGTGFTLTHNTAFQYTVNRKKPAKRTVRKSTLSKVSSPVECDLKVICPIDAIRGGDLIYLTNCGPGNGKWLVGDCTRSIFQIYTECTLIPPVSPLSEQEAAGTGNQVADASAQGSGTVLAAMIQEATSISGSNLPYVWGGGHSQVGVPSVGVPGDGNTMTQKGFDCSGSVSAVLGAGGLLTAPQGTQSMISALGSNAVPGRGSGSQYVTIWIDPTVHVFLEFNPGNDNNGSQYFGTWVGGAVSGPGSGRENKAATGATWWRHGTPAPLTSSYTPYHVPLAVLSTPLTTVSTGTAAVGPQYVMYTALSTSFGTIPATPYALAGHTGSIYNALLTAYSAEASSDSSTTFTQVLAITTSPTNYTPGDAGAAVLDTINGAAAPTDAGSWANGVISQSGQGSQSMPIIYATLANMPTVISSLKSAGVATMNYRLWAVDHTGSSHIPSGLGIGACEWTTGSAYNTSTVSASFFTKPPSQSQLLGGN